MLRCPKCGSEDLTAYDGWVIGRAWPILRIACRECRHKVTVESLIRAAVRKAKKEAKP